VYRSYGCPDFQGTSAKEFRCHAQRQSYALRPSAAESGGGASAHRVWKCVSSGKEAVRLMNVSAVVVTAES